MSKLLHFFKQKKLTNKQNNNYPTIYEKFDLRSNTGLVDYAG